MVMFTRLRMDTWVIGEPWTNSAQSEMVGITLAGIYDQVGDAWREPVNAPNGGFTQHHT